jgi:hypothetical protein
MTLKHTPGPWNTTGNGLVYSVDEVVADATFGCMNGETTIANARLIASAPDLLAALQEIAAAGYDSAHSYPGAGWLIAHEKFAAFARAAISKATGE